MARYKDIELLDVMILSNKSDEFCEGVRFALEEVDKLPTADVVEVKHGEWIYIDSDLGWEVIKCSVCEKEYSVVEDEERPTYCPYCGAKMDGGKTE